jgi:hypothetical protein
MVDHVVDTTVVRAFLFARVPGVVLRCYSDGFVDAHSWIWIMIHYGSDGITVSLTYLFALHFAECCYRYGYAFTREMMAEYRTSDTAFVLGPVDRDDSAHTTTVVPLPLYRFFDLPDCICCGGIDTSVLPHAGTVVVTGSCLHLASTHHVRYRTPPVFHTLFGIRWWIRPLLHAWTVPLLIIRLIIPTLAAHYARDYS